MSWEDKSLCKEDPYLNLIHVYPLASAYSVLNLLGIDKQIIWLEETLLTSIKFYSASVCRLSGSHDSTKTNTTSNVWWRMLWSFCFKQKASRTCMDNMDISTNVDNNLKILIYIMGLIQFLRNMLQYISSMFGEMIIRINKYLLPGYSKSLLILKQ